jgi:hypothetical protein
VTMIVDSLKKANSAEVATTEKETKE